MKKIFITLIIFLIISSCTTTKMYEETIAIENKAEVGEKSGFLSEEIDIIAESIENQLPYNSRVLILDFEDLEGSITYFGRYVADVESRTIFLEFDIFSLNKISECSINL